MLASLGVMLEKPSPTQISPRPYFSVTPEGQKESGEHKESWPDITMSPAMREK
jgi:hypothetical protein